MLDGGVGSDPELEQLQRQAKALMRKRARSLRASLPASAAAERSAAIRRALAAHAGLARAQRVALFWPIEDRREVDLRPLDGELRARGLSIAYPAIDPASNRMSFRLVSDPALLEERGKGFAEPPADAPELGALDLIVVPGLSFDASGHRLGYGGGYYDRTLPRYRPPALALGVCFDFQLAVELPRGDADVPVDAIVTDRRVLACGSAGSPDP